jgi:hypothetical protein
LKNSEKRPGPEEIRGFFIGFLNGNLPVYNLLISWGNLVGEKLKRKSERVPISMENKKYQVIWYPKLVNISS